MAEPKTVNLEPYWPSVEEFLKHLEATDPPTFKHVIANMGEGEWEKVQAAAERVREEEAAAQA